MSSLPRRKIGSRACDGCKIRKVRCSEVPPCARCRSIGIECTFNRRQARRGPRSLRAKALAEIRNIQENHVHGQDSAGFGNTNSLPDEPSTTASLGSSTIGAEPERPSGTSSGGLLPSELSIRTPVSSLIVRLCIYRSRLFPVWPILAAEDVIASLLRDPTDLETYALANAVCAATIAQLKLPFEGRADDNDTATAASMAAECQRARALLQDSGDGPDLNLNMLRISFFQHIYHENQRPGGRRSLLFLREAITIAQIMGLHRKSSFASLPSEEQQMRRRMLWLLFVTERGVAMLHKLPIILTWQSSFPALGESSGEHDEAHILPAFKKLVDLFWIFDQSGAFDLLVHDSADAHQSSRLEYLQRRLQEISSDDDGSNDVQKADILVTKSWMQAVLWRRVSFGQASRLFQPYWIVNDFLSHICHYSKTALEAHGPTIELKIFEIASALTDTLATNSDLLRSSGIMDVRPVDMLIQLQRLLASSRGGNKTLLTLLCTRIAEVESAGSPELVGSPPNVPRTDATEADHDQDGERGFGAGRQAPSRASDSAYLDPGSTKINYPLQLPVWPNHRQEPSHPIFSLDPDRSLGMMFTQLANESWNDWAVDFPGTSQVML